MVRQVNAATVALVKTFEGYRANAYLCPAKVWTIGYGHTGPEVTNGLACTKRQAELWLKEDLATAGAKVRRLIGPVTDELTDNQYGALCSFVLNLGADPKWTLWKKLKARDFDAIPGQFVRFVYAGGKKLSGLVRRRNAEVELWSTDEPGSEARELPSSTTRELPTPPAAEKPKASPIAVACIGACSSVGAAVKPVMEAVSPFAAHSEYVGGMVSVLATVGAVSAAVVTFFIWKQRREAKS